MKRLLLILLGAGGLLALVVVLGCTCFPASLVYCMSARYAHMPPDDKALENLLKEQPGVVAHTVHTHRNGDELYVLFITEGAVWIRHPFPDLAGICASLGYGPPSEWKDAEGDVSF